MRLWGVPAIGGVVLDSLGPGGMVLVLGSFAQFLYVQSPCGLAGWLVLDQAGRRAGGQTVRR